MSSLLIRIAAICALLLYAGLSQAKAPGNPQQATDYYRKVGDRLGLTLKVGPRGSTLTQIVMFLGFKGMTANDLEVQPPDRLMPATPAEFQALADEAQFPAAFLAHRKFEDFRNGKVIAVRYFAPKVANYDMAEGYSAMPGWRKLVRLQALEGSPAKQKGIKAGWVLFNTVRPPQGSSWGIDDIFPTKQNQGEFLNSEAIQIILERREGGLFFLTYVGKYRRGQLELPPYGLSLYLEAKFDVADAYPDVPDGRYYVPSACARCHGHVFNGPKLDNIDEVLSGSHAKRLTLNYLATDQWYDARSYDDFKNLNHYDVPVLIDAHPHEAAYDEIFKRIRKLNEWIRDQNLRAAQGENTLSVRAVGKWLGNHAKSSAYVDQWTRVLQPTTGSLVWDENNENDKKLLPMLDRYCGRCHVTMFFGIYDKKTVRDNAILAIRRINHDSSADRYKRMPQGRQMPERDKQKLVEYLETLLQENAP